MKVRCKFYCSFKDENNCQISLSPVYCVHSKENEEFIKNTPGGDIRFLAVHQPVLDSFVIGKEYYIDIIPA